MPLEGGQGRDEVRKNGKRGCEEKEGKGKRTFESFSNFFHSVIRRRFERSTRMFHLLEYSLRTQVTRTKRVSLCFPNLVDSDLFRLRTNQARRSARAREREKGYSLSVVALTPTNLSHSACTNDFNAPLRCSNPSFNRSLPKFKSLNVALG
jgi:hypothetical protein